jgi:hypothetical protein
MNLAWLKEHWYYVAAALVGVFVLYELVTSMGGSSSSSAASPDVSGTANALQTYSAANDLQEAQVNGQVEVASYQADVANNQTAAALQLGEVQTAAELDATNTKTNAGVETTRINDQTALGVNGQNVSGAEQIQQTVSDAAVAQTQIEGNTIEALGAQKEAVNLAITRNVGQQISNIQEYSKNAGKDYGAIAPVLAEETGQGGSVGAAKPVTSNAPSATAQAVNAGATGISAILAGLFA